MTIPPCPVCGSTSKRERTLVCSHGVLVAFVGGAILALGLVGVWISIHVVFGLTPRFDVVIATLIATIGGLVLGRTTAVCLSRLQAQVLTRAAPMNRPPCPVCGSERQRKRSRWGRYGVLGSVIGAPMLAAGLISLAMALSSPTMPDFLTAAIAATVGGIVLTARRPPYRCHDCNHEF